MTIFEAIIDGRIPASFVHQDAHCVAFMDINPMSPGHVLVVPRTAVARLASLDPQARAHCWELAVAIGTAQQSALGSLAQHFLVNDGREASQSVPHVHIHVIPRYGRDQLRTVGRIAWHIATLTIPRRERPARRQQLQRQAEAIAAALPSMPGMTD